MRGVNLIPLSEKTGIFLFLSPVEGLVVVFVLEDETDGVSSGAGGGGSGCRGGCFCVGGLIA